MRMFGKFVLWSSAILFPFAVIFGFLCLMTIMAIMRNPVCATFYHYPN